MTETLNENRLPLNRPLKRATNLSIVVTLLMAAASVAGLLFPTVLYATAELQQSSLTNDVVNLIVGLPVLLGSLWFARRGSLRGLLLWPGALLYVVYNYLAYTFGNPFGWITLVSLTLVLTSTFASLNLMRCIDPETVKARLADSTPRKTAGVVMIVFGVFFILRTLGMIAGAFMEQTPLPISETGLAVADIMLSILWIIGGVLLLRRKPLGYIAGLGLLFAASALFIGLLVYFILQPFVADVPFAFVDFFVVLLMGLICFVPFGLYLRAIKAPQTK